MIKFQYNFRDVYSPVTSITNTLTSGTVGLNQSTLLIENKKYENITDVIYQVTTAGSYNIVFKQCLFFRCDVIFESLVGFGNVKFEKCTFIECEKIVDTDEVIGSTITIESSIVYKCLFSMTYCTISLDKSVYSNFYGYMGGLNITGSRKDNPLFLYEIDLSFNIGVLMSKSRGYFFNSPALKEENTGWTVDAGCFLETRGTKTEAYDSIEIEIPCDSYKKNIFLPDFKKFVNDNGDLIQIWNYNKEQKYINIAWLTNGLDQDEMKAIITMQTMKNTNINFFPDSDDDSKYLSGTLNKTDNTELSKNNNIFYDTTKYNIDSILFTGIVVSIMVNQEVGNWRI